MWYPNRKKSAKKITIRELSEHYKVHRHTIAKYSNGTDLKDFWQCVRLVEKLNEKFK